MVTERYSAVARLLHWTIAFLIVAQFAGGWLMTHLNVPNELRFNAFQLHKSFGFVVLFLSLFRLYWRLTHKTPPLPQGMTAWEESLAKLTHWLFYVLMIGVPLLGWALVSADTLGIPTKLFFFIPVPHLPLPVDEGVAGLMSELHEYAAFATMGLLVLHVGAALKHHFVDRDSVLVGMLPVKANSNGDVAARMLAGIVGVVGLALAIMVLALGGDHEEEAVPTYASTPVQQTAVQNSKDLGADEWLIDLENTKVEATAAAYGQEYVAVFPVGEASVTLNLDAPEDGGAINAVINVAQLAAQGSTAGTLKDKGWFDVESYPMAIFTSENIKKQDDGSFVANGTLTIKDQAQVLDLPFTVTRTDTGVEAIGELEIDRLAFGVGAPGGGIDDIAAVRVTVVASKP